MKKCKSGYYYCNTDKKCKPIPKGYRIGYGGYLRHDKDDDDSNGKKKNGNGNGGNGNGGNGGNGNGNGSGGNGGGNGGSNGGGGGMSEGSLHKWFKGSKSKDGKGGWVNVVTGGTCASDEPGEGTPKCVSSSKRASMTKAERLSAARRKKKADPGQQSKSGAAKPTYVSTDSPRKKKMKESHSDWRNDLNELKFGEKGKTFFYNDPAARRNTLKQTGKDPGRFDGAKQYMGGKAVSALKHVAGPVAAGLAVSKGVDSLMKMRKKKEEQKEGVEYIDENLISTGLKVGAKQVAKQIAKRGLKRTATRAAIKVGGKAGGKAAQQAGQVAARETKKAALDTAAAVGKGASEGLKKRKEVALGNIQKKTERMVSGEVQESSVVAQPKKKYGKFEKAGRVMGGIGGSVGGGLAGATVSAPTGPGALAGTVAGGLAGDIAGTKVGGTIGKKIDKVLSKKNPPIKKESYSDWRTDFEEAYGGAGVSRKAKLASTHPPTAQAAVKNIPTETDRGAGNKAMRRAGKPVEKKSPNYKAYIMNKEEKEMPKNVKGIAKELDKAVEMHKSQAKRLRKAGVSEEIVTEGDKKGKGSGSKDACYHKVKSRYSVWPSAYASGALVKCRKVGAANWGNSSKKEEFEPTGVSFQQFSEKCWKGYEKKGMKTMFGKRYPNCVKKEEVENVDEKIKYDKSGSSMDYFLGADPKKTQHYKDTVKKKTKKEEVEILDERQKDSDNQRLSQERGRSNYGKASVRNMRAFGKGGNAADPAERLVAIDARHKAHKEKRGVKTKGMSEAKVDDKKIFGVTADRNERRFGKKGAFDMRGSGSRGQDPSERAKLAAKRGEEHRARRGVKTKGVKEEVGVSTNAEMMKARKEAELRKKEQDAVSKKMRKEEITTLQDANGNDFIQVVDVISSKKIMSDWRNELSEDDMKGMSVKSGHKRPTKSGAGMTKKGVEAYRRRNPGSKLKTAVTTEPSKLKKGSKAANRRKSYCARSAGQMKKFPKAAKDPDSRLRQARRRWNC